MQRKQFPPKHVDPVNFRGADADEEEEEDEEEFDLVGAMNEMPVLSRRKVYALKGLLDEYKGVRAKFREELALLQVEHLRAAQRLHDVRAEIVRGVRDITSDELAAATATVTESSGVREIDSDDDKDDNEEAAGRAKGSKAVCVVAPQEKGRLEAAAAAADGGIPDFWLTAMCNTEVLDSMITERDRQALGFLQDITMEYVDSNPQTGVRLNFAFAPNEYFSNAVLSKTFMMCFDEDSGEIEIESMKATPVEWKSPEKNLTVVIKTRKQRHKSSKNIRVVKREEKCPSFFDFFTDPLKDDDDEEEDNENEKKENEEGAKKQKSAHDDDDDDEDDEEDVAELHIEAGQLLMEELVPKAAFFYTGKSIEHAARALQSQLNIMFDGDEEEEDEEEDDDDDDDDDDVAAVAAAAAAGPRRGMHGRGRGGGGGGGRGAANAKECKQQ